MEDKSNIFPVRIDTYEAQTIYGLFTTVFPGPSHCRCSTNTEHLQ